MTSVSLSLVSLGMPWGRHSMVISQPRRVTRVKSGTASHPTLNMKARKFATPFSSHAVPLTLWQRFAGVMFVVFARDTHALKSCSFRVRIFTSRDTRANTLARWRWFKVRAARRRSRSSLDPGSVCYYNGIIYLSGSTWSPRRNGWFPVACRPAA